MKETVPINRSGALGVLFVFALSVTGVASAQERPKPKQVHILYPLHVRLPLSEINTGYGVKFALGQGMEHFIEIANTAGLRVLSSKPEKGWFYLELKKPA